MDKGSGFFGIGMTGMTLAAVFAAFFGARQAAAPAGGAADAGSSSSSAPARVERERDAPPYDRGERLLRGFFGERLGEGPCAGEGCWRLDVLVAHVPDPYDSRLDWSYDAQIEALRRAHETAGFVIDRFWLPPTGDSVEVAALGDSVPRRHAQPGVVLFRHGDAGERRLRLLYLVGETPTGGIHRRALEAALGERERLRAGSARLAAGSAPDTLRLVGPVFSGSAGSLARTLEDWLGERPGAAASLATGSATSPENARTLTGGGRLPVAFRATVNTDDVLDRALGESVLEPLGISRGEVAVLRESSTQYGLGAARRSADRSLVIPFPMNISAVRREYEKNPDARAAADPRIPGQAGPAPRVALSLQDGPRPREGPPTVSPQLTPAAAELALDEIVSALRHHGIRMVGIQATDVRDKLFLAEHLRKRMRDIRLYTFESNTLFLRGDRNASLRGMLVLSSYPLVLENQWWSGGGPRERIAFSSDAAQGTYNAALLHLGSSEAALETRPPFAAEGEAAALPPVWVTAVGTRSFLPMATWTPAGSPAAPGRGPAAVAAPSLEPESVGFGALGAALLLGLALLGMSAASLMGTVARIREMPRPGRDAPHPTAAVETAESVAAPAAAAAEEEQPAPALAGAVAVTAGEEEGARAQAAVTTSAASPAAAGPSAAARVQVGPIAVVAPAPEPPPARGWRGLVGADLGDALGTTRDEVLLGSLLLHREVYTALRLVAAAGIFAPLVALLWLAASPGSGWMTAGLVVVAGVWAAAVGVAVAQALRVLRVYALQGTRYALRRGSWRCADGWLWRFEVSGRVLVVALGGLYAWLTAWYVYDLAAMAGDPARFGLFHHRAVQLGSGLSPLVPILVTGMGFTLWSLWHLQRIGRLSETTAFELACLQRAGRGARRDAECAEDRIACAVNDVRNRLFLLVPHPRGVALLGFLAMLVAWLLPQFGLTLEAVSLGRTGEGTPSFDWLFRFSVSATLVATAWAVYRMLAVWSALQRCLFAVEETPLHDALGHLPAHVARLTRMTLLGKYHTFAVDALVAQRWRRLQALDPDAPAEGHNTGRSWRVKMWDPGAAACGERFTAVLDRLCTLWQEAPPATAAPPAAAAEAKPAEGEAKPAEPSPEARWKEAAESFVAVQLVEYVHGVLQQFRSLALFLFVSLLLTTALVSTYPFQPQSLVKLVFLCVLGATVGSLLLVMTQMNADPVLSRIAKTDPGRVTWDGPFVLNGLLVAVVPLLALVSSEYPALRTLLFAWVDPLAKAFSGG